MEDKIWIKESNQTEPNQPTKPANQFQTMGISISPYLHIFISPSLHISMPISCLRIFMPICLPISVPIQAYKHATTITHLYKPTPTPPIWERENLGSLSSIFFWNFFLNFFFAEFQKVLFCGCGYFWGSAFFWVKHFDKERFFFLQEWYFVR